MTDAADGLAVPEVTDWLSDIEKAKRALDKWNKRCEKIRKRYRADSTATHRKSEYQMLWANVETLKPAVFARLPQAVCARRYRDSDPVGRTAGELLERAVNFTLDTSDYESRFKQVAANLVMYARGTARLRYEPVTSLVETDDPLDVADMLGPEAAEQEERQESAPVEVLDFEHVRIDFVAREDFIHPQARAWEELPWLAFQVFMTRKECVDRFGEEIGKAITLDAGPELQDTDRKADAIMKATVYEVWDKTAKEVIWIAKGYPDFLDRSEPYLKLEGFFPCPKPAYGTMTSDSLEPIPDYVYYQDQAEEINKLTNRIDALADSLKMVGFYPGGPDGEGSPEIERAVRPGFENRLIAVKSWAAFMEGGKGGAPIVWLPIENVADIIEKCISLRKELISDVWELTGVSDIMRGQGESDETATGVNAKSKFGMSRLSMKQAEMARFARDIVRMVAEIVCDQFQPDTLMQMANMPLPSARDFMTMSMPVPAPLALPPPGAPPGQAPGQGAPPVPPALPGGAPMSAPPPAMGGMPSPITPTTSSPSALPMAPSAPQSAMMPNGASPPMLPSPSPSNAGATSAPVTSDQVFALLKSGVMRIFRIDIETDSTIASDEAQDRADRTDFIGAMTKFVEAWGPVIQAQPIMAPLAGELLKFGARGFRIGRGLEEAIDETTDKLNAIAAQPKPPPQPSPDDQLKLQIEQIKGQAEITNTKLQMQAAAQQNQQQILNGKMDLQRSMLDHEHAQAQHQMSMQKLMATAAPGAGATAQPPQQPAAPSAPSAPPSPAGEPLPGAQQAPDGHWYVPDAMRPGKYHRIEMR